MKKVLIDTWWNVNSLRRRSVAVAQFVLIDTWWNVNKAKYDKIINGGYGFNRYMVECEYFPSFFISL